MLRNPGARKALHLYEEIKRTEVKLAELRRQFLELCGDDSGVWPDVVDAALEESPVDTRPAPA